VLDQVIKNGTIVDGSGADGYRADVGIRDGRIVAIGETDEPAARVVDAEGLVVAPGFIDVHTHYDAQVFWDPALTPSCQHGITTVLGGNCGFTIAPIADDHADYLMRMLARVEGMPLESLEQGVTWGKWRTYDEWLQQIDGALAINAGFMAGHSAIRRVVMGEDALDANPSEAQLQAMETELRQALAAGALGFSSSNGKSHLDGNNQPVPSRWASDDELVRLCRVAGEFPGTSLEYIPNGVAAEGGRMIAMSAAAGRQINWNVLVITPARTKAVDEELGVSDLAADRGARVFALANPGPLNSRRSFFTGFGLNALPDWAPIIALPVPERLEALKRPDVRHTMREGIKRGDVRNAELLDYADYTIEETFAPDNKRLTGRKVSSIAAERGQEPFDTLLDIVVSDGLRTTLVPREIGGSDESWAYRAQVWRDPRVVLGASDAGAHLDMLALFVYTTHLLGDAVRERQLLTLEEAVRMLTDVPARLYGLRERGRLEVGWHADIVVLDPATIAPGPVVTRDDLPGGAPRLYADAVGIEHLFVNGTEVLEGGRLTGAQPGTLIRSGRDTR
jgi:N-acyl-D-aspartate/D-glutamate deacylase